jgi:tetratricopeptide (TPR) repeat protein
MWDLAVREDDYGAVDGMLRRFSGAPLSYRIVPAYARRDTAAMTAVVEEARNLDARQSQIAARFVATYLENPAAAEQLAQLDLQPRRNAAIRLGAQSFLAWLDVARGRWSAARAGFDAAERMEGGAAAKLERASAAALPFTAATPDELASIRASLSAWTPEADAPPAGAAPLAVALRPHLRLYLLGLLAAKAGDADAAMRHATDLARLEAPPTAARVVRALVATIRADVALRRNQPGEALTLLRDANGHVPLELVMVRPFVSTRDFTQEHARYLRAQALLGTGQPAEARRWLETSFQGSPLEMVYRAPVHRMLATALRQLGDAPAADEHTRRAAKLTN